VTLLLNPEAILAATNAYNLNQQILTELNTDAVGSDRSARWLAAA
jgi:hypothetical protein